MGDNLDERRRKRACDRDDRNHTRGPGTQAMSSATGLQTEYPFVLPKGYVDREGNLHRKGMMRLATANDEIAPLRDPRVRQNEAYLSVILLSRVVTRLGTLSDVNPGVIENIFSAD